MAKWCLVKAYIKFKLPITESFTDRDILEVVSLYLPLVFQNMNHRPRALSPPKTRKKQIQNCEASFCFYHCYNIFTPFQKDILFSANFLSIFYRLTGQQLIVLDLMWNMPWYLWIWFLTGLIVHKTCLKLHKLRNYIFSPFYMSFENMTAFVFQELDSRVYF